MNLTNFDLRVKKVSKIFTLMGSLWANYILFEIKKYKGVIFHETEERYNIWRGIDLSFQNWHKEFDKISPEHSKVSKIFILMGSYWAKYIFFELKKYRGVILHQTEDGYKIFGGINSLFQNWHKEFDKIGPKHLKVSKNFILMCSFWAKYTLFELKKSTEELSCMKLKRDTKLGEESTGAFKIGIRNLTNFDLKEASKVSKIFTLMGSL